MKTILLSLIISLMGSLAFTKANNVAVPHDMGGGNLVYYWSNEEGVLDKTVASGTSETYKEKDRMWQGIPSIYKTKSKRMWCAFQTGDVIEGSDGINNYNVMYYSDDEGKTWSENYIIFDCATETIRLTNPTFFEDQFGKLWLILIRGGLNGTYGIEVKNPECENPETELEFGTPKSWLKVPPTHRPTILSNGVWITPVESQASNQVTYICRPNDKNGTYSWTSITQTPAKSLYGNKSWGEAQIIELNDESLMMLSRLPGTSGGGMEISYSDDYGANWSVYKGDNGEPYQTPNSKFHIQRLESGNILLITHKTTLLRAKLCAYLSLDDGKTYPYELMIDDSEIGNKWGVSYAEAAQRQGENGEIYIAYDAGRYDQKEIRMAIITEEDIMEGRIISETSVLRKVINTASDYKAYSSLKETFDKYYYVKIGTDKNDVIKTLPTTLTLIREDGSEKVITGTWGSKDYLSNIKGTYEVSFNYEEKLDDLYTDRYSLLKVYIVVDDEKAEKNNTNEPIVTTKDINKDKPNTGSPKSEGCNSNLFVTLYSLIFSLVLILILLIKQQKYIRRKK